MKGHAAPTGAAGRSVQVALAPLALRWGRRDAPDRRDRPARARYRLFGRLYPFVSRLHDRSGALAWRRRVAGGARGRVLEVGSGHGPMFRHYSDRVTHVVAVEPQPRLRALAEGAGRSAPVPVTVIGAVASELPFGDAQFDTVVLSLVLCTVPSPQEALAEVRRVLREDGQVRFLEHVRTGRRHWAGVQRAVDIVWPHVAGGCHLTRDAVGEFREAGFEVREVEHVRLRRAPGVASLAPHVVGAAAPSR